MEENFNVGDVVCLKSGGSKMTVESFTDNEKKSLVCVWFVANKCFRESFPKEVLKHFTFDPAVIVV